VVWHSLLKSEHVKTVDLVAMLGGVHLSEEVTLQMTDDPSQPLDPSWHFLPRKATLPFLSSVCNQKQTWVPWDTSHNILIT